MKLLYKPKMQTIECRRCRAQYLPKLRNLTYMSGKSIKDGVKCPICNTINSAIFLGKETVDESYN